MVTQPDANTERGHGHRPPIVDKDVTTVQRRAALLTTMPYEIPVDEATTGKFTEGRYPESSVGKTGPLAIQPTCPMSHKDLWQPYVLGMCRRRSRSGYLLERCIPCPLFSR
jgi:hypothetical protein